VVLAAGLASVLAASRVVALDDVAVRCAAALLLVLVVAALAARTAGPVLMATLVAAALGAAAVASGWSVLLAGAAVATAVLSAVLAIMLTVPAPTFRLAAREAVVALGVGSLGALGVVGFRVRLGQDRFGYVVLALALALALTLVHRLGAGLHGLGRRGLVIAGAAVLVLAVALAYSAALGRWGSPDIVDATDRVRFGVRAHLHGVPHPIEALFGVPALCWGVFMRARRRQGWWVSAFGVAATASATTHLVDPGVTLLPTALSAVYSLAVGLLLGYVLIRGEQYLTGSHGRRARRVEEAAAHRPEPGRLDTLH
jgi:hypothetical protein